MSILRAQQRPRPVVMPVAANPQAIAPKQTSRRASRPIDSFTPAAAPVINSTRRFDAVIDAAYTSNLGRPPDAEELRKGREFAATLEQQGKTAEELRAAFTFVIALGPEWQGRESYRAQLGRDPQASELEKLKTWGAALQAEGKSPGEMRAGFDFVLAMTPEWQGKSAYQELLGRAPSADELQRMKDWGTSLQAEGKSTGDMRAAFNFVLAMTPEWQGRDAYRAMLGREPSATELQQTTAWGAQLQAEGKTVEEMRGAFNFVLGMTPEYQEAHRARLNTNRDELYLQQPNGWSCGPTSLTMALAASGVKPSNLDTMWDLAGQLGARAGVGTPGGVSLIADVARRNGVNAEANASTQPADMRAALERGHGIVVNGDIGGGGHFIYISGLDLAGNYIVCDPFRPGITSWGDAELYEFTHHGNNPPGFAEIWP